MILSITRVKTLRLSKDLVCEDIERVVLGVQGDTLFSRGFF